MIKGLQCEGDGEAFTILFDHDAGEATLSTGAVTTLYRYEQGEKFLTWRLTDDAGRLRYTIREGDAVNGELGWYFSATKSVDENATSQPAGRASRFG